MDNNAFIVFVLNLKTNKIISTNITKYLNETFDVFYDCVLSQAHLSEFEEVYNENILYNELRNNTSKVLLFHVKSSSTIFQFSISKVNKDCVTCTITFYSEIINEKYFSKLDYLTGLYSRAYLIFEVEEKIKISKSYNFCLFIIDLNDFKKINDTLGHRIGDEALRQFAQNLKKVANDDTIIGRYGGDEFVLFTIDKSDDELKILAKQILNIQSSIEFNNKVYTTTCCLGASIVKSSFATFDYLLERADNNLYQVKKFNKHCAFIDDIVVYGNNAIKKPFNPLKKYKLFNDEIKARKRKNSLFATIIFMVLLVFSLIIGLTFDKNLRLRTLNEAESTMSMISSQIESSISSNIYSWFSQLNICDQMLSEITQIDNNQSEIDEKLNSFSNQISFERVALLLKSGDLYFAGDIHYNIASEKIDEEIIVNKNSYIESIYVNYNGKCVIFGIPFSNRKEKETYSTNNNIYGICGLISLTKIESSLVTSAFDNQTRISIVSEDGFMISQSLNSDTSYKNENIFNVFKTHLSNEEYKKTMEEYNNNNQYTVNMKLDIQEEEKDVMLFFAPLEFDNIICNWHIIILVPKENILKNINRIMNSLILLFMTLIFIAAVLLVICVDLINRSKLKIEINEYIDSTVDGINYKRFEIDGANLIKSSSKYALVYFNIVKFKILIEQIGKDNSDILLKNIYQLIQDNLKENELVARIFEDRFILLIECESEKLEERILNIKDKIHDLILTQYDLNSIIIAGVYAPNKKMTDFNLANAKVRIALQNIGSDYLIHPICYYSDDLMFDEINQSALESKAEMALNNHDFVVYYQAKRNVQKDKWTSCEALVRWCDSNQGIIPPSKFIPLFEKNGFIIKLDLYVFEKVCKDLREIIDSKKEPVKVSINISRKNLLINNFIVNYDRLIKKYNIDPKLIEFELTESMASDNEEVLKETIKAIHEIGCTCSIDDFGSGYSSLGMLTKFDFDIIKLDRSFFIDTNNSKQKSMKIIESVITLVKSLGKDVVAEGIEDEEQVEFLVKAKCDEIQGFYFSKPQPLNDFLSLIEKE